jgi:hypothetical protein
MQRPGEKGFLLVSLPKQIKEQRKTNQPATTMMRYNLFFYSNKEQNFKKNGKTRNKFRIFCGAGRQNKT